MNFGYEIETTSLVDAGEAEDVLTAWFSAFGVALGGVRATRARTGSRLALWVDRPLTAQEQTDLQAEIDGRAWRTPDGWTVEKRRRLIAAIDAAFTTAQATVLRRIVRELQ